MKEQSVNSKKLENYGFTGNLSLKSLKSAQKKNMDQGKICYMEQ